MNSRSEQLPRFSLCGLFVLTVFASPAVAQVRSWTGSILDGVENPLNWTPYGVPLTNDNIFIGNIVPDAEASIDSVLTFASLTMSNAANLQDYRGGYYVDPFSFDGSQLTVTGATILSNTSALGVRLTTGSLTLNNSSFYDSDFLEVGTTTAIGPAAELGIYGDAMFRGVAGNALNNNGVITAGGMTLIEATNGGMLDLDGTGETGRIVVTQSPQYNNDDGELTIAGTLSDDFDGELTLINGDISSNASITFTSPWTAGSNSVINFQTTTSASSGPGAVLGFGDIHGAAFTSHGTINLTGTNRIFTEATLDEGAVVNTETFGNIDFRHSTTLGDVTFTGSGGAIFRDSLTVRGGTTLIEANSSLRDTPSILIESDGVLQQEGNLTFETMGTIQVEPGGTLDLRGATHIESGLSTIDGLMRLRGPTTLDGGFLGEGTMTFGNNTNVLNGSTIQVDTVTFHNFAQNNVEIAVFGSTINAKNLRVRDSNVQSASTTVRVTGASTVNVFDPTTELGTLSVGVTNHGEGTSNNSHVIVDGRSTTERPTIDVEGKIILGASGYGEQGHGSLEVLNGALVTAGSDIQIGGRGYHIPGYGSEGFVTVGGIGNVSGLSARLSTLGDIILGFDGLSGDAALTINEGGQVVANGLTMWPAAEVFHNGGSIDVQNFQISDAATYHLDGGNFFISGGNGSFGSDFAYGSAALESPSFFVHTGADVTVAGSWTIADEEGTYGTTNVGGAMPDGSRRSTLQNTGNGNLRVGNLGGGTLNIDAGGLVAFDGRTEIGYGASSGGYVNVRDVYDVNGILYRSEMQVLGGAASVLIVGNSGYGQLNIENGGLVETVSNAYLGMFEHSLGEVTVGGESQGFPAELNVAGRITVGNQGTGMLTINSGGLVAAEEMFVRDGSEVRVNGGTLSLDLLDVNTNGGVVYLNGDFTYDVDDTNGDLDLVNGIVQPGDSPGIMTVNGNYTSIDTTLEIELGGLIAGMEFDRVDVFGAAAIDGTLDVTLYDLGDGLFTPAAGDSFDIFFASDGISGNFDDVNFPELSPDLEWNLSYGSNLISLAVLENKSADFDGSGIIDGSDLAVWIDHYGVNSGADADDDGDTDGWDFLDWQRNAQANSAGSITASLASVPEPTTLVLLSSMTALALGLKRRTARAA